MSCCRARVSSYGADYTGPGSPDYDYSTDADKFATTYTDPAYSNPDGVDYPNAPWGTSNGVVRMDAEHIEGNVDHYVGPGAADAWTSLPDVPKAPLGMLAGALAIGALIIFGSDDKKKRRRSRR